MSDIVRREVEIKISWPDLNFPPVNLTILAPAWFFYATADEREAYFKELWSPPKPATLMVELPIDVVKSWLNYQSQHEAIAAAEFVGKVLRKALEEMR